MEQHLLASFLVTGISYRKSNATVRGAFALTKAQLQQLLHQAKLAGVNSLYIVSTCNRTELYTYQQYHATVVQLLLQYTGNPSAAYQEHFFTKTAMAAVHHLLQVSAGLDSQILGDYEIVGQIKQSFALAQQAGTIDTFLDRCLRNALQCSKKVKTETQISTGTTSVAFAAIQYLKQQFTSVKNKHIVVLGTGKIGRYTCKNLLDYTDAATITLLNRTESKALTLAQELQLITRPFTELNAALAMADVIIVSTADSAPLVTPSQLPEGKEQLLIDLSIPNNISVSCGAMFGKTLMNVDQLATVADATLAARRQEVPLAESLIQDHIGLFKEWLRSRKHAPYIAAAKHRFTVMSQCQLFSKYCKTQPQLFVTQPMQQKAQRSIKQLSENIRRENRGGCHVIDAINHFITPSS